MSFTLRCLRGFVAFGLLLSAPSLRADTPPETAAAVEAIRSAIRKGDLDAAEASALKATQKEPRSSELQLWLGRVYAQKAMAASMFGKMSLAGKCKDAFEKAVELDGRNVEARWDLMGFYLQAPGIAGGGTDKATAQAREILKIDEMRGHMALATIAEHDKDAAAAEAEYKKALAVDPKSVRAGIALANFWMNQKRFDEARAFWTGVLAADGTSQHAHYQLAKIALLSGKGLEGGVEHLKKYLAMPARSDAPTHADAHWRLGLLYEQLGKTQEAKAELKQALELNPSHPQAKKDAARLGI